MKLYHTTTQEDYDDLMFEFKRQDKLSPNHYKFGDMEVRHFLDRVFKYGGFDAVSAPYVSNAIEYICRAPRKEGIEDYKKALNNLKFLIDILEEAE